MSTEASTTPELDKMMAVQTESQAIGEFVEWLATKGMTICTSTNALRGADFYPVLETTEALLASYFEIDMKAVERERRAILADIPTA